MHGDPRQTNQTHPRRSRSARAPRGGRGVRRRGTVMVYVLGVLTLVALIGLILIARTHGEFKRVAHETTASSVQAAVNGAIRVIQETLQDDIWGPGTNPMYPLTHDASGGPLAETNEPWDAPGPDDRWIASTYPYRYGDVGPGTTGHQDPPWNSERDVLAWHRVSYLGTDVVRSSDGRGTAPFAWADNARTPGDRTYYGRAVRQPDGTFRSSLEGVLLLQTHVPGAVDVNGDPLPMIPGSTTNLTIAEARMLWEDPAQQADLLALLGPGVAPRFPYFDTNADGIVDLYDADGDGVPDAPISFAVPMDDGDPNAPEQLYAVIRIVDHAGMINANVASSILRPGGASGELTFDEALPGLQRRGRRLPELLLDELVHADDGFTRNNRTAAMVEYRSGDDPVAFDADVVRRQLVGGWLAGASYFLYGLGDEASLRHRGCLVPHPLRDFDKAALTGDYRTIDRALRGTLLWTRQVDGSGSYLTDASRWNRLNADYEPFDSGGLYNAYEGYDDANARRGWRTLLQEDVPPAVRRPMITTVSHEVVPPPLGIRVDPTDPSGTRIQGLAGTSPVRFPMGLSGPQGVQMAWPVLDRGNFPDLPDWMRIQPIDLNMSLSTPDGDVEATKQTFIRYLAAAMYMALEGVDRYQDIPLIDLPMTRENDALNREWLAWQFALNVADYRDSDGEPTLLQWVYQDPGGQAEQSRTLVGLEKQPFLTEAYAYLVAGDEEGGEGPEGENMPQEDNSWFFAVELFVPPLWNIPTDNLYLRSPGATGLGPLPLGQFLRQGRPPILNGGADGNYFVFCGNTTDAPGDLDTSTFYQNLAFEIATDGYGRVELLYAPGGDEANPAAHVQDVIGPAYSGGHLAGRGPTEFPGLGAWAHRSPDIPSGSHRAFSLLRSTKGWRFSTAWHLYTVAPSQGNDPNPPQRRSLGAANETFDSLDGNIPESIWPTMVTTRTADHEPLHGPRSRPGFGSGLPYEAFDSVGQISRMLTVGPAAYAAGLPRYPSLPAFTGNNLPVTAFISRTLAAGPTGDLPSNTEERVAAGRVDFVDARDADGAPWTWRLLSYLTTQSHLFDGIDNDGDGRVDLEDMGEGADVLYRVAGRVNVNTAPFSGLRTVPFMSLLPTSAEYIYHAAGGAPVANPSQEYQDAPLGFWDLASAIVATREGRPVPLRLADDNGILQTVAIADRLGGPGGGDPSGAEPFTSLPDLMKLTWRGSRIGDVYGNHALYRIDRFWSDPGVPLWNHKVQGGDPDLGGGDPFSPDFRYCSDNGAIDYVPITEPANAASDPLEAGGIRGRDIFLARWANLLTTRSDVFTAYIALLDEDGHYVHRAQVTLDRTECFREVPVTATIDPASAVGQRVRILPRILSRQETSYTDDTR